MTNPYFSNNKVLLLYSVIIAIVTTVHILILNFFVQTPLAYSIADGLVFNIVFYFLGISLWFPTKYFSLENFTLIRVFINHISGAIITSVLWIFIGYFILLNIFPENEKFLNSSILWRFFEGVFLYIILVTVNYLIIYYGNFREKSLKEVELRALVKEAELKSLKYQIKPHFIFNSLNSISSLTMIDPERARDMIIKLSDFMRGTLAKSTGQKYSLEEELKNVKLYLDIEKIRFEDKFIYTEDVSDGCWKVEVPNLILQPIFENAIKYGVYEITETVEIKLTCKRQAEYMVITISNNYDPDSVPRKGEGIGLNNIRQRLKLIYNQDNLLSVKNENNIFTVYLFIPL